MLGFKNENILFYACMLAIVICAVTAFPVKEQQQNEVSANENNHESKDVEAFEAAVIRYLDLLSKKKLQEELNQRRNYETASIYDDAETSGVERVAKRNPEFTNSLMLYSKLFRKLDQIGKRR